MIDDDPLRDVREAVAAQAREYVATRPDLARAPTRDDLVKLGKSLWAISYKHNDDDLKAFDRLAGIMSSLMRGSADPSSVILASNFLYLPMEQLTMYWSARWTDQAFPVFQLGHKYAAALLATAVTVNEDDIRPPFGAFLIEVPIGLLSIEDDDGKSYDVRHVLAHHLVNAKGERVWHYVTFTTGRVTVWQHGASITQMLEEHPVDLGKQWEDYSFGLEVHDRDKRIIFLLQRLILNTCLAVSTPGNLKPVGKTTHMSPGEMRMATEPLVRTYQVGKPITLDCRDVVRDYVEGRKPRQKLSIQVLVAGHWKSQPHGPKNSLRKVIWRLPYWRGPEDAPILVRPHKLEHTE